MNSVAEDIMQPKGLVLEGVSSAFSICVRGGVRKKKQRAAAAKIVPTVRRTVAPHFSTNYDRVHLLSKSLLSSREKEKLLCLPAI